MSAIKLERLASQIIRDLSQIIYEEAKDATIKSITITGAEVTNDYSVAKIYYTFLGDYDKDFIAEELKKASSYLRTELAERLDVRHTPELRFYYDQSIAYGANIEKILEEINNK